MGKRIRKAEGSAGFRILLLARILFHALSTASWKVKKG
jgi:hypothetical protein